MRTERCRSSWFKRCAAKPLAIKTGKVPRPKANINRALSMALPWLAAHSSVLYTKPHGSQPQSAPRSRARGRLVTASKRLASG